MWPFRHKAASPIPERKSATFFFSPGAGKAGLTSAGYERLSAEGYAQCVIAFDCINRIASAVASVEPQVYRKRRGGKLEKLEDHPLLDLIENPNPAQSGKEFLRHLVSYHRLSGNAYVYGNGLDSAQRRPKPPTELQLFNPGKVQVKPGPSYLPASYEYKPIPSQQFIYPVDQVTGFSAVMQIKTFNPLNPWYGMSPLAAGALAVDIHNEGQQWNKKLIENGARPSGALVMKAADGKPAMLSDEQYSRLKEMIDDQFSGPANAGRPMLLEGGMDWQEMSINPKDMEFLEGKNSAARDIALAFGVPPQMLGIPGDNTYSNYSEAKLAFWTETVLPLLGIVHEGFNRWLAPLYGDDVFLWYDEETIPALEPMRKAKMERMEAASFLTIDEKRRAAGYDDYQPTDAPGGQLFVAATNIPLSMAGSLDPSLHPQLADPPQDNPDQAAKHRDWLIRQGYTEERAERLTKLVYG